MHMWSDEDFDDWEALDRAVDLVDDFCAKYGRLGGQSKQKYGSIRFYASFGMSLHSLIFPRYVYFKHRSFPDWLWKLDLYFITPLFRRMGLSWVWHKWQCWVYREAHRKAIAKYPHIRAEILGSPDFPELLKGL